MNLPKLLINKYYNNPLIRYCVMMLSNQERKKIFKKSTLIPINFNEKSFFNQATHPDIIYSYKRKGYILTVSRYPYGIEKWEDPFLFFSTDGICFQNVIDDAVDVYGGNRESHFSDSDLCENNGFIYLYYRYCENECDDRRDIIYLKTTTDMSNWSDKILVNSFKKDKCLSPAIIHINDLWEMYYVELFDKSFGSRLCRLRADNYCFRKADKKAVTIIGMPPGCLLWHIDIIAEKDKLHGLFVLSTGKGGKDSKLFYADSLDLGKTWTIHKEIQIDINKQLIKKIYRSSMVKSGNKWNIYISMCSKKDCWYVAVNKQVDLNTLL